uniref:Heat shock protein 70 n=1 Tax=Panagrolaimus davidi TaxID=227884 RepID=A0A914QPW8_9BILA
MYDLWAIEIKRFLQSIAKIYPIPKSPTFYDSSLNAVGIDLGTTRSCTAVNKNGKIDVIAIDNSDRPLPSFVGYEEGLPICGSHVARRMPNYSKHAVFDVKRIIGKPYESVVIDPFWPFKVIKDGYDVKIKTLNSKNNDIFLSPEEISAVLLKHMKLKAEEYKQAVLKEAVITVPVAFNQNQIDATLEAAALAGWETIHILPEPIAACFTYASENEIPANSNVMLFDFGGGTLDICIVRIENEHLQILKSCGDLYLGGRNFDTLLMNHSMLILEKIHNIDIRNNNYRKYKLLLDVGDFHPDIDATIPITRQTFKELSQEILVRLNAKVRETLDSINFTPDQINYVLQVGGGCRMAMVKELLRDIFPNSQHRSTVDPDWAVAYGASLYCCHLMTETV